MKSDAGREQISSSTCEGPPAEVNSGQQEGQAQGSGVKQGQQSKLYNFDFK